MKTAEQLVAEATAQITTLEPADALSLQESGKAVLVDIRDIRELARKGKVPGAIHAPRGMLEFWVDRESPYYRDVFSQQDKTFVLFCAAAGRSALAARDLQEMGFGPVAQIGGGFSRWEEEGLPIEGKPEGDEA